MAGVEPRKVVVEAEIAVVVAPIPVTRRADAMHERAILEHRKIECSAIPRYELRRVAFDSVEEAPDQLGLRVAQLAERPYGQRGAVAQNTAHGNHAMQIQRWKFAAGRRTPIIAVPREHVFVANLRRNIVDPANAIDIGHRFNVESEDRRHAGPSATARGRTLVRRETHRSKNSGRPDHRRRIRSSRFRLRCRGAAQRRTHRRPKFRKRSPPRVQAAAPYLRPRPATRTRLDPRAMRRRSWAGTPAAICECRGFAIPLRAARR